MKTINPLTALGRRCPIALMILLGLLVFPAVCMADEPDDFEAICVPELQDCEEESDLPGCNDPLCCKAVCMIDLFCCTIEWDDICAAMATEHCIPLPCPEGGSCFELGDPEQPGCNDESCCELVCNFFDSFCCSGYWDATCVELALALCVEPLCKLPPPGDDELMEPEECAERTNEGCNFTDAEFTEIACGEKYRGTAFSGAPRDTDWYRFDVDEPGEYTWTVTSEFPSTVLVMQGDCDFDLRVISRAYGGDCSPVSVTFDADVGEYFLFVSPGTPAGPLRSGVRCPPDDDDDDDNNGDDPPPPTHFGIEYIAQLSSDLCPPSIPGDLNGDGVVNGQDLLILLQNWGDCPDPDDCLGDINGDGVVNGSDLLILLQNWS